MSDLSANGGAPQSEEIGLTFEEAQSELEQTIAQLQHGQLSLDDTLRLYERGSALVRHCYEKLDSVEFKLAQLLSHPNGTYSARPIASEKDVSPPETLAEQPSNATAEPGAEVPRRQQELFD